MATSLVLFLCLCAAAVYSQESCPDARCAGPARNLRATSITSTSVTLEWTRPELIIGPDFHYTYQIFDQNGNIPDRSTRLPLPSFFQSITFPLNGLQPATAYVINIAANNGEDSRKALIQIKTNEEEPSPPRNVRAICPMVVWGPPANPNGQIQGYEIQLTGSASGTVSITKTASETYHVISDPQDILKGSISIQVRAATSAGFGEYSEAVTLDSLGCCSESECPSLTNPANGVVTVITKSVGGTASYSCNTGYSLSGTQDRTCQSNGEWSGSAPICQPVQCPSLIDPLNGRVTVSARSFNGRATYSCNTGYTLSGSATRICQSNGAWSGSAPTCQASQCPSLSNPANGRVTISVNGRATYSCNTGYTLSGSSSRTCQSNGVWSGSAPTCQLQASKCPNLINPGNGRLISLSIAAGGRAVYSCHTGYFLNGSIELVCLSNGAWSGPAPTCEPYQCTNLADPTNGKVIITRVTFGGIAIFTCNTNYTLSGSSSLICQPNGIWNGPAPTCQSDNVGFTLGGSFFANNSRVSLSSIGVDEEALIFSAENENCCQTQRIGECYYPDGTQVSVRASPDQFYRNRRLQTVRLNKKPSARAGGRSAPTGLYCCTIPDKEGTLQRVCVNITA